MFQIPMPTQTPPAGMMSGAMPDGKAPAAPSMMPQMGIPMPGKKLYRQSLFVVSKVCQTWKQQIDM